MTSFRGKAIGHSFLFMYNSEWEFNLKGTHCMCSYALTIMKNLRIMSKKKRRAFLFKTQLHFPSVFPLEQSVLQFLKLLAYFNQTEGWEF